MMINLILARQPYSRNATGEFELHFFSWRMTYCVLFYCIELVMTVLTGYEVVVKMNKMEASVFATDVTTHSYDVTIFTTLLLIFLFAQLVIPLLNWMVAKRYIAFLNRWKHFEVGSNFSFIQVVA
ncbi:uncharacterized protein LOC120350183 [Nilaparvata lugens]|uniref:uncharacterized protein LOC120350183 n=1 Tax=Nilaparvata lugens TaxID=108931 RepID=UPI00193D5A01|nr:uncharacterized protein LOC120350183 [Nilaparvata lugens]